MFSPNAFSYITATPSQRRTAQRNEDFVTLSEHTAAPTSKHNRSKMPRQSSAHAAEPVTAHEEKTHSRSRRDSKHGDTGHHGAQFMKEGILNLQTYFNTVFGSQPTNGQRCYDAQRRDWEVPPDPVATRDVSQLGNNPPPIYRAPSPVQGQQSSRGVAPSSGSPLRDSQHDDHQHHHHHRHREGVRTPNVDGTSEQLARSNPSTTQASRGVAPAVVLRAVRHMHVHVIRVPASSADEAAEAELAELSTPCAVTPAECAGEADKEGTLDNVCHTLWMQTTRENTPTPPAPNDDASPPVLVSRYFIYEKTTDGDLARVEPTNFRGCSVCLKKFRKGEEVGELPCRHLYHLSCIHRWLRLNDTCPNCRLTINAALVASLPWSGNVEKI